MIRVSTVLLNTVPEWWIGLLLLIILGSYLQVVPLGGMETIGDGSLPDRLHHLALPATVSAIGGWIGFSRILRFEMLEVLNQDYVRTARAKGLGAEPAPLAPCAAQCIDALRDRPGWDLPADPVGLGALRDRLFLAGHGPAGDRGHQQP